MHFQTKGWYVGATAQELKNAPLTRRILDVPIVFFRDPTGRPRALFDRCPHRGVPLSTGKVVSGTMECGYHGWRFDGSGECVAVPGLSSEPRSEARCVRSFPVQEAQGFLWIWMDSHTPPDCEPFHFRLADEPNYTIVRKTLSAPGDVLAVAENALDVPHTAFLHGGLFRTDSERNPIECRLERTHNKVVVEYVGEPRPEGIAAKILSPSGGVVTHFDRFYLPSIVEVEYRIGDENHIVLNAACTPVTEQETLLYAVVAVRSRIPGFVLKPVVTPIALWIFDQDVRMLSLQTQYKEAYGERYISTEIDLLGPQIARLLKRAADDQLDALKEPYRRTVTMMV